MRAAVALSLAFVALRQYRAAEKFEDESNVSVALYHVSFDAEGECELLP